MAFDIVDHEVLSSSVTSLTTLFDCPICLDMLKDPVRTTSCGHTFCRMCIKKVLRKLTKEPCPICKTLLSNRNIVEDEKMSVFLGLVIELISSINTDLGFDVTAYYTKPISSYEASLNSEEFLNMKSNTVAANKLFNDTDTLMTSRNPLTETFPSNGDQNVGASKENVDSVFRKKTTDYLKSSPGSVDKQVKVHNKSRGETKVSMSADKLSRGKNCSNTRQHSVLTSKGNIADQKAAINMDIDESTVPALKNHGDFTFLKPKPAKNLLKRKHTSSSDGDIADITKEVSTNEDIRPDEDGDAVKTRENTTKKMKIVQEEEMKIEDVSKKRKFKIISEKKKIMKSKFNVPGERDNSLESVKNVGKLSESSLAPHNKKSSTFIKTSSDVTRTTSKKTLVECKMYKRAKIATMKLKKTTENSTFKPKKLNEKTSKFYFITSLMMRRDGQKPVSVMKRTYPVREKHLTCAKETISSNQDGDSITRNLCTSVSVQTSPIKSKRIMRQTPIKREKSTETKEKNDDSVNVGENVVNSDCLESQKLLVPRKASIFCGKGIENDRVMNDPSDILNQKTECPKNNVSQEDMDIFEPPEAELHASKKIKMKSDQKVVELNDDDSDLTQVNPNILNRHNVCTRKTVTPKSARKTSLASGSADISDAATLRNPNYKEKEALNDEIGILDVGLEGESNGSVLNKSAIGKSPCRQKSTEEKSPQRPKSPVDETPSRRQKRRIIPNSDKSFSMIDSNTSPRMAKTDVRLSSPFLSSATRKQISTANITGKQSSEDAEITSVIPAEQLRNTQMICRKKSLDHEVVNSNRKNSNNYEESALNKSKVDESPSRRLRRRIKPVSDKSFSIDDSNCTPRLSDQSMGNENANSQRKDMSQMDTAFCGSTLSEPLDTQQIMECARIEEKYAMQNENQNETEKTGPVVDIDQMAVATEQVDSEEIPQVIIIDGSDDEIPETPTKNRPSEILTQQLNNSKLDKSISESQKSIIPSSLEITQMPSTSTTIRKLTKSPKNQLAQKKKAPNSTGTKTFKKPEEKKETIFKKPQYSFVYSRLASALLETLEAFAQKIDAKITANITEATTHVIIVPEDNRASHTFKYLKGVAKRLWVVSIEWVLRSLESNKILPEVDFVPLDLSGEPGPWRCKYTDSLPLANFVVVPMPPYDTINDEQVKELILLCGAKVVVDIQSLGELKPNTPRILLTDEDLDLKTFERLLEVNMIVPVHVSWLLDSIGRYKAAPLTNHFHFPIRNIEILLYLGVSDELIIDDSESDSEAEDTES